MLIGELLDAIESADSTTPRGKGKILIELSAPVVLDEKGRRAGRRGGVMFYAYSRAQCYRIRERIHAAVHAEYPPLSTRALD